MLFQVRELGPAFAHGTLDVESNMVYLKTMMHSRKNLLEGFARLQQYDEQVFWWTLDKDHMTIPPAMRHEFNWSTAGHGEGLTLLLDAHTAPLDNILGLWHAEGLLPPLVVEWLAFYADAKRTLRKHNKR